MCRLFEQRGTMGTALIHEGVANADGTLKYLRTEDYVNRQQDFRGGDGFVLDLTSEQETSLRTCLIKSRGPWRAFGNSCTMQIQDCPRKIAMETEIAPLMARGQG
jgi:hypothetical protein